MQAPVTIPMHSTLSGEVCGNKTAVQRTVRLGFVTLKNRYYEISANNVENILQINKSTENELISVIS